MNYIKKTARVEVIVTPTSIIKTASNEDYFFDYVSYCILQSQLDFLVKINDYHVVDDKRIMVMEPLKGLLLHRHIKTLDIDKRLKLYNEVLTWIPEILEKSKSIQKKCNDWRHDQILYHQDIKPHNIMMTKSGMKLFDPDSFMWCDKTKIAMQYNLTQTCFFTEIFEDLETLCI